MTKQVPFNAGLVTTWAEVRRTGSSGALATVVHIVGSSYQPLGARMLISSSGVSVGTVSGGCLEADVLHRAGAVMASGKPVVVVYDASGESDVPLGFNLGCQGKVSILIEPLNHAEAVLNHLLLCRQSRQCVLIATLLDGEHVGSHLCLGPDFDYPSDGPWARGDLAAAARSVYGEQRSQVTVVAGPEAATVLWEVVAPPINLLLCGAGEDARPLSALAATLQWDVTIVDHRPAYLTRERFPAPNYLMLWREQPEQVLDASPWRPDELSAAVMMTHHFERDERLLTWLLTTACPYLGILGPRQRTLRLLSALRANSSAATYAASAEARLHSPVGLDIGAETPESIALAILAEVHTVLAGRSGAFLRATPGPLHQRQQPLAAANAS